MSASPTPGAAVGTPHSHASPKPHGRIAHNTRGRVRLQFGREDRQRLEAISARLREMDHVKEVEIRPASGSVVIQHAPNAPDFVALLQDFVGETGLFFLEAPKDAKAGVQHFTAVERDAHYLIEHSRMGEQVLRYAEHLNWAVKQATQGWIDLRVLLPASVAVCALLVINVESSPMWLPLALFSYQSFSNLHQPAPVVPPAENALPAPAPITIEASASSPVPKPQSRGSAKRPAAPRSAPPRA